MKRIASWFVVWGSALAVSGAALAEEGKGALPQLDPKLYPGLLFWLAVCYPILLLLMHYLAVPRVQNAQSKRRQVLRVDLEAAEKDNGQAKALREAYEKTLAEARTQAQATINAMAQAAANEEAERRAAQHEALTKRLVEAEGRIAKVREKALAEAREAAAGLAETIVNKLINFKAT